MNKFCISFILLFLSIHLSAQNTYYYKLTKKVHNNTPSTKVSGGQFITFMGEICYESDKKGIGVGHGTMTRSGILSSDKIVAYMGESYWGKEATYNFTRDLSILNVVTENGDVYLYKRMAPPAGVTTCSLIKPKASGSGNGGGVVVSNVPVSQPIGGGYYNNGGGIGGSNGNSGSTSTSQQRTQPVQHTCPHCHGNRTIVRENNVATFGNDTQRYCSICGRNYWASSGHSHVTCPQCHGKGYFTTN